MPSHTLCALTRLSPCIARFVFGRRRLDVCTVLDGGNTQPLSTLSGQDSLTRALKTSCHLELKIRWLHPHHSLQVDTCGIRTHAGRPHRLSRSANVSSAKSASQLHSSPGSHVTVSLCFLCPLTSPSHPLSAKSASQLHSSPGSHVTVSLCFLCPLTSPSHPLSPTHENNVHQSGIEPGSHRWQQRILPLDH